MGAITLSLPDSLKKEMERQQWVNWSSVAREAFQEKLRELALLERIRRISEMADGDAREAKESMIREVIGSTDRTLRQKKSPMTEEDLRALFFPDG